MRVVIAFLVVVSSLACRKAAAPVAPPTPVVEEDVAPPPNPLRWSVSSPNRSALLSQTAFGAAGCEVVCVVEGKPAWREPGCLARDTDFAFVANDCAFALLLFEYPLRGTSTETTQVATLMRGATARRNVALQELMEASKANGEGRRVRWLTGVAGESGLKPHLNEAGTAIEFSTVDGQQRVVHLSNPEELFVRPTAAVTALPPQVVAEAQMYQFVGDDGSTQFVMGLDQVPAKFRKKATPVESEISSVKGVKMQRTAVWATSYEPERRPMPPATPRQPWQPPPESDVIFGLSKTVTDAVLANQRRPMSDFTRR